MRKYIVYTPLYSEHIGGIIVLHSLCALLREQGCDARIWPAQKPHPGELRTFKGIRKAIRWRLGSVPKYLPRGASLEQLPHGLVFAEIDDLKDAIVVYPEIVTDNPLRADKVVRWLLNKPDGIAYGPSDLVFYFDEQFNDWQRNPDGRNHLYVLELMRDIYQETGTGTRQGTCYMVRKAGDKPLDQHEEGAVRVDGMSHREIAAVFNRCMYFVSYDVYTLYSRYAAMCGCIPVVIPDAGVSREQWRPKQEGRYGIAYGWDDIPWALDSRKDLLAYLDQIDAENRRSVAGFIETTQARFGDTG